MRHAQGLSFPRVRESFLTPILCNFNKSYSAMTDATHATSWVMNKCVGRATCAENLQLVGDHCALAYIIGPLHAYEMKYVYDGQKSQTPSKRMNKNRPNTVHHIISRPTREYNAYWVSISPSIPLSIQMAGRLIHGLCRANECLCY